MKTSCITLIGALVLGASAWMANAQGTNRPPPQGERPPPSPPPIIAALDANHDGMIDATEIANASTALKALDKNGDGQLTRDEMCPHHPGGQGAGGPPFDPPTSAAI